MKISIETLVKAPLAQTWQAWTDPAEVIHWNFAADTWCCPKADSDLKVGGSFSYRMEEKSGDVGFDFSGTFTTIEPMQSICFHLGDNRTVEVQFIETNAGVKVIETFEAEDEHSAEQQKQGWQAILDNFKVYVEAK